MRDDPHAVAISHSAVDNAVTEPRADRTLNVAKCISDETRGSEPSALAGVVIQPGRPGCRKFDIRSGRPGPEKIS
jgi:hypothetical protein